MGINELEKVVRGAAAEKDLYSIEKSSLSPEFAEATRTLAQRRGKKRPVAMSLLNPTTSLWI